MKLTAFFITICLVQVHAEAFSQRVNLDKQHTPIDEVLRSIEEQTGYHFVYDGRELQNVDAISVRFVNTPLSQALDQIFKNTAFSYKMFDNTIVLRRQITPRKSTLQPIQIEGAVVDKNGNRLPGVSVRVKGRSIATSTDNEGQFKLQVPDGGLTIEFSFLGFKTQELPASTSFMQIQMVPDPGNLDEVVVIGYGTTTQRLNTGSVSSITSEILARQPVTDPLAALQGRVPGLMITSNSGMPGSSFNVRIRGEGSLQAGNEPLYIVDGVPFSATPLNQFNGANGSQNPLNSINPNDIERIDVLKDADATAIYGSRGANGVILITTKRGKAGKTQVNLNVYTGFSQAASSLDMLSVDQYLDLRREAFKNDGEEPTEDNGYDLLLWDPNQNTDWQEALIGHSAPMTEAQLSFSGGSDQTRFLVSGNYSHQGTSMPGDFAYKRGAAHLNINHHSEDGRFNFGASVNYSSDNNNVVPSDVSQFYNLSPNFPRYDDNGELYWIGNLQNPFAYLERNYRSKTTTLIGNAIIGYQLLDNFRFETSLGYTKNGMDQVQTLPRKSFNPMNYTGSIGQYGFSDNWSYIIEPQLRYTLDMGKGSFDFLLGGTLQQSVAEAHNLYGTSYTSDSQLENMQNAADLTVRGFSYSDYRFASIFGRIRYNYADKYLANATFRRDGSSRFGSERPFGDFGSIGGAWLFSNENWVKERLSILSFGKIRASYGNTGNDQIGSYQYLDTWSSTFAYQGVTALYPSRVHNPFFGWEDNRKTEVGLELGFLKDRLFVNTSYYNNRSGSQLTDIKLSSQSGFDSYLGNTVASVENSGWEFDLSSTNFSTEDFKWTTALNISFPKNKLLKYPNLENTPDAHKYVIGESIRIVKGFDFIGVDPQTGLGQYRDLNDDQSLDEPDDFVILGDLLPKYFGGFNNDFQYKGLSLSVFFQFVKQEGPGINYGPYASPYGALVNQDIRALDRWQQPGDITDIPRATVSSQNEAYTNFRDYYRYSSAAWGDASFIRLKNVSLSYDLSEWVKAYSIRRLSVYAQAQNLLTFTSYHGLDPEMQGFDRSTISEVLPFGTVRPPVMPAMRTFTFGVQIGF